MTTIKEIHDRMMGQDNRMTSYPMFVVREEIKAGGKVVLPWVTVFFSNKGAERYIEENRHNLENPHIYVASGYDNDEWQAVRSMLLEPKND